MPQNCPAKIPVISSDDATLNTQSWHDHEAIDVKIDIHPDSLRLLLPHRIDSSKTAGTGNLLRKLAEEKGRPLPSGLLRDASVVSKTFVARLTVDLQHSRHEGLTENTRAIGRTVILKDADSARMISEGRQRDRRGAYLTQRGWKATRRQIL